MQFMEVKLQVKQYNPDFLEAKGLPVPDWLKRKSQDIPAVFE